MAAPPTVRPLDPEDLAAVTAIDEKLTGHARKDYWRTRFDIAALRPPWMSAVAEVEGRLAGFLFGWVGESEFGIAGPTAWIDLIGVDPAYRGRGVARAQSAVVLRLTKRAVRASAGVPFDRALTALEELYRFDLMQTEDAIEGLRAFAEKRAPLWRDR